MTVEPFWLEAPDQSLRQGDYFPGCARVRRRTGEQLVGVPRFAINGK
jgi:hypothetical protein